MTRKHTQECQSPSPSRRAWRTGPLVATAAGILLLGIVVGRTMTKLPEPMKRYPPSAVAHPALTQTQDPLWPQIQAVAKHFLCGCGQCGVMKLVECVCDMTKGGMAEKQFIRSQLLAGKTAEQVIAMVEKQYGYRVLTPDAIERLDTALNGTTTSRQR